MWFWLVRLSDWGVVIGWVSIGRMDVVVSLHNVVFGCSFSISQSPPFGRICQYVDMVWFQGLSESLAGNGKRTYRFLAASENLMALSVRYDLWMLNAKIWSGVSDEQCDLFGTQQLAEKCK